MADNTLENWPQGFSGYVSKYIGPISDDVYRLIEMGLCIGAKFTIIRKAKLFGMLEIALDDSRLCIAEDLASKFFVSESVKFNR